MPNNAGLIALAHHRLAGSLLYSAVISTRLCPIEGPLLPLSTLIYAQ